MVVDFASGRERQKQTRQHQDCDRVDHLSTTPLCPSLT